jgi:hypothetical protein
VASGDHLGPLGNCRQVFGSDLNQCFCVNTLKECIFMDTLLRQLDVFSSTVHRVKVGKIMNH